MSNYAFLQLFLDYTALFFACLIPTVLVFIRIAKILGNSWLNPIRFSVLINGIGISVAIFLFLTDNAKSDTFYYVITSSALFWFVLCYKQRPIPKPKRISVNHERYLNPRIYVVIYILYIISYLWTYKALGIPLFNDGSRLTTYVGSGLGFLSRLQPFFMAYIIFYLLNRYRSHYLGKFKLVLLCMPVIIFGFLSGSRSSFLQIVFAVWGYYTFYVGVEPNLSKYKSLIMIFILVSLLSFAIQNAASGENPLFSFAFRAVASGDIYWQAMPDDLWKSIVVKSPMKDNLIGLLGPMRLMKESECDKIIGFQLTELANNSDSMTGPIPLVPIASLIYYGYNCGLIYTVVQAFLARICINLFYRRCNSLLESAFLYFAFNSSLSFIVSISIGVGSLFDIIFNYMFLFILKSAILTGKESNKNEENINYSCHV